MSFLSKSASAIGRLLVVGSLAVAFFAGAAGVAYLQLKGEEVEIPKVVGKNFNDGQDELAAFGLRIKKIASRYSEEKPNTILEQRPRAGSAAKSGQRILVVVAQENPEGTEAPADVKEDEDGVEEIEDLPELETEKPRKKKKTKPKKESAKTRDVIEEKPDETKSTEQTTAGSNDKPAGDPKAGNAKKPNGTGSEAKPPVKPPVNKSDKPAKKPAENNKPKPKPDSGSRPRTSGKSN